MTDPRGALEAAQTQWRTQLADLGGRNTLMWHRDLPTGTIDLTVAHPGGVAKLLAGHNTLLSELTREAVALGETRRRVSAIRAKSVQLQREYGLSTLFLAVGMASWSLPRVPVPPRAPVLLRGARIRPTDASRRDFVLRLDSDVIFNPALQHYLRGERGIDVDGSELARASIGRHGFDPRPTYDLLEELCAGLPEFGIGPQLVLSTYPLAKLPLVAELAGPADLLDRRPLLRELAVVAGGAVDGHAPTAAEPPAPEVEATAPAAEATAPAAEAQSATQATPSVSTVLEVDQAQRGVLAALAAGQSIVLDAEPGTGRTQTIVGAICRAVGEGGSVLVAAEHRRALEDVQDRMRALGLGDLVLDVRETPAAARRAAAALIDDLDRLGAPPEGSDAATPGAASDAQDDPLEVLREHREALHARREPWGVTLAETQDVLTRLAALSHPPASHVRLGPAVLTGLTPAALADVRTALTRAVDKGAWRRRGEDLWFGARISTEQEAERAAAVVADLVGGRLLDARERVNVIARSAGLPAPVNLQQWQRVYDLLRQVRDTLDVFTPDVYEAPLDELVRATVKQPRGSSERVTGMSRARLRRQARSLLRPGTPPPDLGDRLAHAQQERTEWEALAGRAARPNTPRGWEQAAAEFEELHNDLTWLAEVLATTPAGKELPTTHLDPLFERLVRLDAQADRLPVVAAVHDDLQPLRDSGLGSLVDDLADRGVPAEHVEAEADLVFWASVHDQMTRTTSIAGGGELREAVTALEETEGARLVRTREAVRRTARERLTAVLAQHPDQEAALRSVVDAGPPLSTLDLTTAAPDLVRALRPCWLASPLTIPATMPADLEFDLVVLDEAQRMPVAHAVPALTRALQVLVVGDSAGLPGLPLVGVAEDRATNDTPAPGPSLIAATRGLVPVHRLSTHYRALDDRMVPRRPGAPVEGYPGVLRQSRITVVETGGREALVGRVVDLVVDHARRSPRHSLAVLVDDQRLVPEVEGALWERVGGEADLVNSFREDVAEPFLLATVERAAGDVRDRVILALSGRDTLSAAWGHSALGSARRSVIVLTDRSLDQMADSPGLGMVRETAQRAGAEPEAGASDERAGSVPALVADLAERLRAEHLVVRHGYGSGPHRIELVVDDPDDLGRPLLAIDTDAHPTDGAVQAADLHTRWVHLRQLGWTPVQVWTTDVFRDPAREVARIVELARQASAARAR